MSGAFAEDGFAVGPFAAFGPEEAAAATPARATIANAPKIVGGDVVRDSNGNIVDATDPIAEEVAFYLTTIAGHFFGDPSIGNNVIKVRVRTSTSIVEIRDHVLRALRPMTQRGDITNVNVQPEPIVHNGYAVNFYRVTYEKTGVLRR